MISHPDLVTPDEVAAYDHVFAASERLARQWSSQAPARVEPLPQCTDKDLFFPDPSGAAGNGDILFVGNSRNVLRPAVRAVIEAGLSPIVYGTRWDGLIDARHVRGTVIENQAVADLYRTAGVVLNDHWPDMQRAGIISNRVFDVLACGTPIVSDEIADLPPGFSEFVITFGPGRPIDRAIARAMSEDAGRRTARRAFAETVRRDHCFDRRAAAIVEMARTLLSQRGQLGSTA
jgi:spore maturation protein CgeB